MADTHARHSIAIACPAGRLGHVCGQAIIVPAEGGIVRCPTCGAWLAVVP